MILNSAENGKHTGMMLTDLQKAFDTLDHKILLGKMKWISFLNKTTKWFHSYLTRRVFFVSLDNVFSTTVTINVGVPKWSTLRPLLLLLYINDIPQALSDSHTHLYADDISIFYQHKNVTEIENVSKTNLQVCSSCLLIISCQFTLVKIKLNIFFSIRTKTCRSLT